MSDTLLWVNTVLTGLCLFATMGSLVLLGRLVEKVERHDEQFKDVEERLRRQAI